MEVLAALLSRASLTGGALALLALSLAGCSNWNDKDSRFASYAEYAASPLASSGQLPSNLLPHSARDIRVHANIDTTEVEANFDFAAADEDKLAMPFLSPEMILQRELIKEGQIPPPAPAESNVLVRCGEGGVEFLQIDRHAHARYWTSWDKRVRASACPRAIVGGTSA